MDKEKFIYMTERKEYFSFPQDEKFLRQKFAKMQNMQKIVKYAKYAQKWQNMKKYAFA